MLTLAIVLLAANAGWAQSVRIQSGEGNRGYGWMFQHAGNCYVIFPRHVAGAAHFDRVSVTTAAPVVNDQAFVMRPFWPQIDLVVGVIDRGALDDRCTARLADLRVSSQGRSADRARMHRISALGTEEWVPLEIRNRSYLEFEGVVSNAASEISEGTSGAFAFVGGRPIGMATNTDQRDYAVFMRAEEIAMNLERFFSERSVAFANPNTPTPKADPNTATQKAGLVIAQALTNTPPLLPQHAPENLQGEGLYVAQPQGAIELTLRLSGDDLQPVQRLRMRAPGDGGFAVPKDIVVLLDQTEAGKNFRFWRDGQMRPDGVFDTGQVAARNARWVRILISSAWEAGPLALDEVVIE